MRANKLYVNIQRTDFPVGPRFKPICSECGMLRPGTSGYKSQDQASEDAMRHLRQVHGGKPARTVEEQHLKNIERQNRRMPPEMRGVLGG